MRPGILALMTRKEIRDLLRDRRTVMLLFLAPFVLYPLFGVTAWFFATELIGKPVKIGVVNRAAAEPKPHAMPYPPLFDGTSFDQGLFTKNLEQNPVLIDLTEGEVDEALRSRQVQVVLILDADFATALEEGRMPKAVYREREGDDQAKIALSRLAEIVGLWERKAREVRFQRDGKPADYDKLVDIDDPRLSKPIEKKAAEELRDSFARAFPLILVMWLVAGAIQPAVDLTAGEKERGTMETLLISPAQRSEIVFSKWLAVTLFGFTSVVWNVLCLTIAALVTQLLLKFTIVNLPGMIGCVVLGLPIAMLLSAVSIALGIFARSTKEGQYYLVPLMLVVMPLAFWSLMPTTELHMGTAIMPIAGGMLLQQKLLSVSGDPIPWLYFVPVLGSQALYIIVALWLAWWQFRREAVLFRETGPAKTSRKGWLKWR